MAVETSGTSELSQARLRSVSTVVFWDRTRPPMIEPRSDDVEYRVKTTDRKDLLAYLHLGDSNLWWVIAVRNNLFLFPNDIYEGRLIYIPTLRSLRDRGILTPNKEP